MFLLALWTRGRPSESNFAQDDNLLRGSQERLPAFVASFIFAWILRLRAPRFAQDDIQGGVNA